MRSKGPHTHTPVIGAVVGTATVCGAPNGASLVRGAINGVLEGAALVMAAIKVLGALLYGALEGALLVIGAVEMSAMRCGALEGVARVRFKIIGVLAGAALVVVGTSLSAVNGYLVLSVAVMCLVEYKCPPSLYMAFEPNPK